MTAMAHPQSLCPIATVTGRRPVAGGVGSPLLPCLPLEFTTVAVEQSLAQPASRMAIGLSGKAPRNRW